MIGMFEPSLLSSQCRMVAKHRCGFNAVAAPPVVAFSPHHHARALSNAPIEVDHFGVEHADAARRHRLPDCVRLVGSVDAEQSVRVAAWPPRRFVIIIVLRWAAIAPALLVAAIVARRWIGRIGRVIIILRDGGMASRHEHANRETDKRGSVSAFVTHASPNGVMEALIAGKPMVAAPLFGDQCYFAARVEGLGGVDSKDSLLGANQIQGCFWEAALGVMDRLVLTDAAWERMAPLIIGRPDQKGSTGRDNRMFVEGVLWIVRTGSPWRDLPEAFGDWNSVFRRFSRWSIKGVWRRIFEAMSDDPDFEYLIVDSTIVRAHQHAAGAKKGGLKIRRSVARVAA